MGEVGPPTSWQPYFTFPYSHWGAQRGSCSARHAGYRLVEEIQVGGKSMTTRKEKREKDE